MILIGFLPSPYRDPELEALRAEIRALERQVLELKERKLEMLRLAERLHVRERTQLGRLIRALLDRELERLRLALQQDPSDLALRHRVEQVEARRALFEERSGGRTVSQLVFDLDAQEQERLKLVFREAIRLCHPDHAPEALRARAEQVCAALVQAYEHQDLLAVEDMLLQLQTEGLTGTRPLGADARQRLERRRETVRQRIALEQRLVEQVAASASYRKAAAIADWDAWFAAAQARLEEQLAAG